MNDWLVGLGVVVVWIVLQVFIFPRLGVHT